MENNHENKNGKKSDKNNSNLLTRIAQNYSGSFTHTALSVISAWMIVMGIKGLAGFTMNERTAFADLLGIITVIALARWVKFKYKVK